MSDTVSTQLLQEQIDHLEAQVNVLHATLEQQQERADRLSLERDEYKKIYELVTLELERLRRHLFGRKAEYVDPGQLQLALLGIAPDVADEVSPEKPSSSSKPSDQPKPRTPHGRKPLPEHLPVERIVLEPPELSGPEAEKYEKIGEEVSETLEWRAASTVRVEVVRPKYAYKGDATEESAETPSAIVVAEPPTKPIEKGLAGPGLLARVMVAKFCDHLPLHRQERIFAREGLDLARSTLGDWVEACHELTKYVVEAMWQEALQSDYVAVDATGVLVQHREKCRRGHFWVLCSDNGHVLFRYSRRHNKQSVGELLGSYKGYIQADAATVYDFLFLTEECTEVGCWSHARRRFFDSLSTDRERALVAMGFIRALYQIDREMREMTSQKLENGLRNGGSELVRCSKSCLRGRMPWRLRYCRRVPSARRSRISGISGRRSAASSKMHACASTIIGVNGSCAERPSVATIGSLSGATTVRSGTRPSFRSSRAVSTGASSPGPTCATSSASCPTGRGDASSSWPPSTGKRPARRRTLSSSLPPIPSGASHWPRNSMLRECLTAPG